MEILVLFKTHLDVGFTDFAANVVRRYNEQYIPRAIQVGRELLELGVEEGFTWTTGSWLIHQYLRDGSPEQRQLMDEAVRRGIIRWHALPVTMHSELADEGLYRYGLSLSQGLDRRYGLTTVGAKCTDVPGHTRAVVPLLAEAGVELLHIGVNPASPAPAVPDLFRWRDPAGREIVVMYNKGDYGEFTPIPGTDTAVYFAHTGDNLGPQSAQEILDIYRRLREAYPGARLRAGDLSDVARAVRPIRDALPVVTAELGDTWIHGAGTDPQKTAPYRALLRLVRGWSTAERGPVYERLLLVPEHTWGLDEKTHLNDHQHFSKADFSQARHGERYRKMEASWAEQRDYVRQAAQAAPEARRAGVEEALAACRPPRIDWTRLEPIPDGAISLGPWRLRIDETGAIAALEREGAGYADPGHRLAAFCYEAFSEREVLDFDQRYLVRDLAWAWEDFGKIGLNAAMERYERFAAARTGLFRDGETLLVRLAGPQRACRRYGCPEEMALALTDTPEGLLLDFRWYDKPASRIPEGLWLGFTLPQPLTAIRKLGEKIAPLDVAPRGNRELHGTEGTLDFGPFKLVTLDAPLISVGQPNLYAFREQPPNPAGGAWVNLCNNAWGTNFPMWNEGDARFRFLLR